MPQLLGSVCRLTQAPEQTLWPVAQVTPPDEELELEEELLLELVPVPLLELELELLEELLLETVPLELDELLEEEELLLDVDLEVVPELPELLDLLPELELLELELLELLLELEEELLLLELLLLELELVPVPPSPPVVPTAVEPHAASESAALTAIERSLAVMEAPLGRVRQNPRATRADDYHTRPTGSPIPGGAAH